MVDAKHKRKAHGPIEVFVLVVSVKEIEHLGVFSRGSLACGDQQAHVECRQTDSECGDHEVGKLICSDVLVGIAVNAVVGNQIPHAVDCGAVEGSEDGGTHRRIEEISPHKHPASELGDSCLGAWCA